jgi:hypothetical protein
MTWVTPPRHARTHPHAPPDAPHAACLSPARQELDAAAAPDEAEVAAPDPSMMRPEKRAFFLSDEGGGAHTQNTHNGRLMIPKRHCV